MSTPDSARRNISLAQGIISIVAGLSALIAWRKLPPYPLRYLAFMLILFGVLTIIACWKLKERWNAKLFIFFFLLVNSPGLPAMWVAHEGMSRTPGVWTAFQIHKLSMITMAILAPVDAWLGYGAILLIGAAAAIQYYWLGSEMRSWIPDTEPWTTLFWVPVSSTLLYLRVRGREMERAAAHAASPAAMVTERNRTFLAIRDLSNSPLQTLLFGVEALKRTHPELEAQTDRMLGSIHKLQSLNAILDERVRKTGSVMQELSMDSESILKSSFPRKEKWGH